MVSFIVLIGFIAGAVILAPFFVGPGGALRASAHLRNHTDIEESKQNVLKRYLRDEAACRSGSITERQWHKRQRFLSCLYVDLVRRDDELKR